MFGFACDETPELMPLPIALAHRLARRLAAVRKNGDAPLPAARRQEPGDRRATSTASRCGIETILICTQHAEEVTQSRSMSDLWEHVVQPSCPAELFDGRRAAPSFYVNPTGRFVIGGPLGDAGLTGRKIIVDTYGGFARHGGGAFCGKDPTKVDRSAAYAARWVAKNIVAAGLATRVELQVAYAIGVARPLSMLVETFGTETGAARASSALVDEHFDLRPAAFRRTCSCTGRSSRRPRPTATSAATTRTSPGSAPTRPTTCAPPPASAPEPARPPPGRAVPAAGRAPPRRTRGRRLTPSVRRPRASRPPSGCPRHGW